MINCGLLTSGAQVQSPDVSVEHLVLTWINITNTYMAQCMLRVLSLSKINTSQYIIVPLPLYFVLSGLFHVIKRMSN